MLRHSRKIYNLKKLKVEGCDDYQTGGASDCMSGTSSSSSAEVNPLKNVVILRHLFELCPANVLSTCRLVCKQWYEESLLTWRSSFPLRFTLENGHIYMEYDEPSVDIDGACHSGLLPLETFLRYVADPKYQCQGKPYRYIRLQNSMIDSNMQFDVFWNAVGSNLTTLELMGCEFPDDEEFRRIIFTLCPKLIRLIVVRCKFSEDSIEEFDPLDYKGQPFEPNNHLKVLKIVGHGKKERRLPVSWLELFSHFPLISSLTLTNLARYSLPEKEFERLVKAIRNIRKKDSNLLPFKIFDIGTFDVSADPVDKQRLTIFQELRLPIRRLFVFAEPGIDDVFFRDTVALCAETVKELYLAGWIPTASCSEFLFGYPLDNGISLGIDKCFSKTSALLESIPNLEKLVIYELDGRELRKITVSTDIPKRAQLNMMKLTQLHLHCLLKDDDVGKIHDWMPNVTILTLEVNDKQFGIVCEKWRNLRSFCVFGKNLTDVGVAGMKNKAGADITNLQHLEAFSFESAKLSAKSVFNGFLQLPNLQFLKQFGKGLVRWGNGTRRAILDRNIQLEGNLKETKVDYPNHRY